MKRIIHCLAIACLLLVLGNALRAQQPVNRWRFHSLNQMGLLQGESKSAFQMQTVNGWGTKDFFAGLGVGLDYYQYKSIPLFLDIRKYFGRGENAFFVYTDGGPHFIWEPKDSHAGYSSSYNTGFYGDGGIGYRRGFKSGMGLLLGVGYSYKRAVEKQSQVICPVWGPCYTQLNTYNYDLNRLSLKIGWLF